MNFRKERHLPNTILNLKEGTPDYLNYEDFVRRELAHSRAHEYLSIKNNELCLWGVSLAEMARNLGTPLEIVSTPTMELRARQITDIILTAKLDTGYRGGHQSFYALKANPSAPYLLTMMREWQALETSSPTDAFNILEEIKAGRAPKKLRVVCNGPKILPVDNALPIQRVKINGLELDDDTPPGIGGTPSYLEIVNQIAQRGVDVTPIIDGLKELDYLCQNKGAIKNVGLRLKVYGVAKSVDDLMHLTSRHGIGIEDIEEAAKKIRNTKQLELTTFHAMVSAAGAPPVDDFIDTLMLTARAYFELKKTNPTLCKFNIGGGIPAIGFSDFDHQQFFNRLFKGVKVLAAKYQMDEPEIQFEMGTPIAKEAGIVVYKIIDRKVNSVDKNGKPVTWLMADGSIMEDAPDIFFVNDMFPVFAINHLNQKIAKRYLGDQTCDGDGRLPRKGHDDEYMIFPDTNGDLYICILAVGAYQETLTGFGGVGHCALAEAERVVIHKKNGILRLKRYPRQSPQSIRNTLGY